MSSQFTSNDQRCSTPGYRDHDTEAQFCGPANREPDLQRIQFISTVKAQFLPFMMHARASPGHACITTCVCMKKWAEVDIPHMVLTCSTFDSGNLNRWAVWADSSSLRCAGLCHRWLCTWMQPSSCRTRAAGTGRSATTSLSRFLCVSKTVFQTACASMAPSVDLCLSGCGELWHTSHLAGLTVSHACVMGRTGAS